MQIPPSTALLHALSRVGDNAQRQPVPPRADAATDRAVTTPDSARAAAKAAFQALRPAQPAPVGAVAQPPAPSAPPAHQPAKPMPRGSVLNVLV
jgi:hypothetical protein